MVEDLKVLEHFSTSDHNMIEFQFVLRTGVGVVWLSQRMTLTFDPVIHHPL